MQKREMENERRRRGRNSSDPHHSTADLLSWSQIPPPSSAAANRSNQPSDGISDVLGSSKTTNEEAESLNKNVSYRKNCSGHKLKEMIGSDIFSDDEPLHKTINHYHLDQHNQMSFSGEDNNVTPKKPIVDAKHEADSSKGKKKQILDGKSKVTGGHDIFASPTPPPRQQEVKGNKNVEESATRNLRESVKASNGKTEENVVRSSKKIHNAKSQELTSNGIFKSDKIPPGYSEKMHSSAKLREMSGNNIFADGKSEYRDYYGGERRPPGGASSISLV